MRDEDVDIGSPEQERRKDEGLARMLEIRLGLLTEARELIWKAREPLDALGWTDHPSARALDEAERVLEIEIDNTKLDLAALP